MLPSSVSPRDWPALRRTAPVWPAVMRAICERHGLAAANLSRLGTGTNVLFSDGRDLVVKLYLRPLLLAYGYRDEELDDRFRARLLAYGLLHRYVGPPLILEFADPDGACATFGDLERVRRRP